MRATNILQSAKETVLQSINEKRVLNYMVLFYNGAIQHNNRIQICSEGP
jgi:hypothetical protein